MDLTNRLGPAAQFILPFAQATGTRLLTIFPQHAVIDASDSQQYFTAAAGVEPHMFSFLVSGSLIRILLRKEWDYDIIAARVWGFHSC